MVPFLNKLYDIRPDERKHTGLMFAYIFFLVAFIMAVKPVSYSLFLYHYGITQLPYAFLMVALVSGFVIYLYGKLIHFFRLASLITIVLVFSIVSLIVFWYLLRTGYQRGWFYYFFFIWLAIFAVITVSQFWLLANRIFNIRQAKRLYGLLGIGAITGGIFGGYTTNILAPHLHNNNMLLIGALFLIACLPLVHFIIREKFSADFHDELSPISHQAAQVGSNILESTFKIPLLSSLVMMVGIGVIVTNVVDYQFRAMAVKVIKNPENLTAFFGFWMATLSTLSLLVQLLLTQKLINSTGVSRSLLILPAGVLLGAFGIFIIPGLAAVVFTKVIEGIFKNSVNKSSMELLFFPIPGAIRDKAKTFIDIFIDNLSRGVGGLILILFAQVLGFSIAEISGVVIILVFIWVLLVLKTKNEYSSAFLQAIEKRTIQFDFDHTSLQDPVLLKTLIKDINQYNDRQIIFLLDLLKGMPDKSMFSELKILLGHQNAEIRVAVIKILNAYNQEDFSDDIKPLINDTQQKVSIAAIHYSCQRSKDMKSSIKYYLNHPDIIIQSSASICAAQEIFVNPNAASFFELEKVFKRLDAVARTNETISQDLKIIMARTAAISQLPSLTVFLESLLQDSNLEVQKEVIKSMGTIRHTPYLDLLIKKLKYKSVRREAREALSHYGTAIIPVLEKMLASKSNNHKILIELIKVLGFSNSRKSIKFLLTELNRGTTSFSSDLIKALTGHKYRFPDLKFDGTIIEDILMKKVYTHAALRNVWLLQRKFIPPHTIISKVGINEPELLARNLLVKALKENLDRSLAKIFQLLGLRYSAHDLDSVYIGIHSKHTRLRANALEYLDNILPFKIKKIFIPLMENHIQREKVTVNTFESEEKIRDDSNSLATLLAMEDSWLKACTLYLLTYIPHTINLEIIKSLIPHTDQIIRELVPGALVQAHGKL